MREGIRSSAHTHVRRPGMACHLHPSRQQPRSKPRLFLDVELRPQGPDPPHLHHPTARCAQPVWVVRVEAGCVDCCCQGGGDHHRTLHTDRESGRRDAGEQFWFDTCACLNVALSMVRSAAAKGVEVTTAPYTGYKECGQGSTLWEPLMMHHGISHLVCLMIPICWFCYLESHLMFPREHPVHDPSRRSHTPVLHSTNGSLHATYVHLVTHLHQENSQQ